MYWAEPKSRDEADDAFSLQGRDVLEGLVDAGFSSHTLLFNLSTMYELCTEKNRMLKMRLADKVAGLEHTARGWEKTNSDFKL